jgi:hypothetical protein
VSEDRIPTFRDWVRTAKRGPNGELVVRIGQNSSDTMSAIRLESPVLMQQLREERKFVVRQLEKRKVSDKPLSQKLREQFPHHVPVSDECLEEVINHEKGKLPAGKIYDREIERCTAGTDYHKVSAKTSKTYRLPSKNSRQGKQTKQGRPRKNRS